MEEENKRHVGKDLLGFMRSQDLLQYGSVLTKNQLYDVLDIIKPEVATEQVYKEINFIVLSATDYVRTQLLKEGKALCQVKGNFRIPLISENASVIQTYMGSADKKLRRALQLSRNTPSIDTVNPIVEAERSARIIIKREFLKQEKLRQDNLK